MAKKSAAGTGNIRKKIIKRNGKEYTYWEARYSAGIDPGTGKQIQRSISGKTQKEVAAKLKSITASIDAGTYIAPCKLKLGDWLDIWSKEYLKGVKQSTVDSYNTQIRVHIKPALGATRIEALTAHAIQSFYNKLGEPTKDKAGLSPKSIKNVHGVLHKALNQAVANGYIRVNPSEACVLPKIQKAQISPLDRSQVKAFINQLPMEEYKNLYKVALFTGMRQSELLGLTWDCINFKNNTIKVNKQLQEKKGKYFFTSPKNNKERTITAANSVIEALQNEQLQQKANKLKYGEMFNNPLNLVFTDPLGKNLVHRTVVKHFKKLVIQIGVPDARFHDLRHTYAVMALQAGDDVKTVQETLGHATAAFTLEVYSHVTQDMKTDSAARMDKYIKQIM